MQHSFIRTILRWYPILIILLLSIIAGWMRYYSISQGASYWNDESNAALFARGILQYGFPVTNTGKSLGIYEFIFLYLTSISFRLWGINEFAGRLPSMLAGTVLIPSIYYVTKKSIGTREGLIAAGLTALLQIQLAWSTQLRPYIWLQLCTVWCIYTIFKYIKEGNKSINRWLIMGVALATIASLFHGTGLLNYGVICAAFFCKTLYLKHYKFLLILPLFLVTIFTNMYFSIDPGLHNIIPLFTGIYLTFSHYIFFLRYSYWWLGIGGAIGGLALLPKNPLLSILLTFSIGFILIVAVTKINPYYVRYSTPAFPLLYILYGAGEIWIADYLSNVVSNSTAKLIISCLVILLGFYLPFQQGKLILYPQPYYSINADIRENPIVDYKTAFHKIEILLKNKPHAIVMDAWNDRVPYYLPGRPFIWLLQNSHGENDPFFGEKKIGTIDRFEKEKEKNSSGIVIVENWQSLTPIELQNHIRATLHFEFEQKTVPGNEQDGWSISVYSWGLHNSKSGTRTL